jgi:hypothetical protein
MTWGIREEIFAPLFSSLWINSFVKYPFEGGAL